MGHHGGRVRIGGCDRFQADDTEVPEASEPGIVLWVFLGAWAWMFEQLGSVPVVLRGTTSTLSTHPHKMHTLKVGSACS